MGKRRPLYLARYPEAGILYMKEKLMPQIETMTLDEKLAISSRAFKLLDAGDRKEYDRVMKTAPLPLIWQR